MGVCRLYPGPCSFPSSLPFFCYETEEISHLLISLCSDLHGCAFPCQGVPGSTNLFRENSIRVAMRDLSGVGPEDEKASCAPSLSSCHSDLSSVAGQSDTFTESLFGGSDDLTIRLYIPKG